MDQSTYEHWWQLHIRVARGEKLTAAEQAQYEAGLAALDVEEAATSQDADLALLRQLRSEVERLEMAHAQLQSRSQRLDRQIWTLEGAYMSLTGLDLSSQSHATSSL